MKVKLIVYILKGRISIALVTKTCSKCIWIMSFEINETEILYLVFVAVYGQGSDNLQSLKTIGI